SLPLTIDATVAAGTTTRIYVASNTPYQTNDTIEVNRDKVARTITSTGTDGTGPYVDLTPALSAGSTTSMTVENWRAKSGSLARNFRPQQKSPVINAGDALVDAGSFKYVDVNKNGSYDEALDIIVVLNGYSPSALDWVITTDIVGNQRVKSGKIDIGVYERSSAGTVLTLR
ncbi:MAG: hypothetical protein C0404_14200, partial [Verrucomicrobia bacterium]|nr:hypothetical protein [Verrucomicrobiota bacterium]